MLLTLSDKRKVEKGSVKSQWEDRGHRGREITVFAKLTVVVNNQRKKYMWNGGRAQNIRKTLKCVLGLLQREGQEICA